MWQCLWIIGWSQIEVIWSFHHVTKGRSFGFVCTSTGHLSKPFILRLYIFRYSIKPVRLPATEEYKFLYLDLSNFPHILLNVRILTLFLWPASCLFWLLWWSGAYAHCKYAVFFYNVLYTTTWLKNKIMVLITLQFFLSTWYYGVFFSDLLAWLLLWFRSIIAWHFLFWWSSEKKLSTGKTKCDCFRCSLLTGPKCSDWCCYGDSPVLAAVQELNN